MNALAYMSYHVSDLAIEAAEGHPMEVNEGGPRLQAIESAEFLGVNDDGRLDDDLFEMYSKRFA
ncbi:hypothetical protein [Salipiger sp. PrR003]|uniref:hypothetical protein n=1 Tax=Salipiger sp. PrR003 TaxID=2706776 RepID=UPI0013D91C03|nr:hypothetical protein [Salipiger sp. PrR003]NDV53078.1 hypothetical protein [Salipiger sp. PrR003]